MKAIGFTLGSGALLLMLFQAVKLFITMEEWTSADYLLVCGAMSFLSTIFLRMGLSSNRE